MESLLHTGTTLAIRIDGITPDEKERLKRYASGLGISFFGRIKMLLGHYMDQLNYFYLETIWR